MTSDQTAENVHQKKLKTILMWSNWDTWMADGLFNTKCPVTSCLFTPDIGLFDESDIVVFYIDTSTNFPMNRHRHQRFVFFNMEPPRYSSLAKLSDERVRFGYFNWTMTYRWDSDILHRYTYGYISAKGRRDAKTTGNATRPMYDWSPETTVDRLVVDNSEQDVDKEYLSLVKQKTKLVAWFVGNCFTSIRREDYVQELSQYIPIDIYGSCSMRNCSNINCDQMLRYEYKFYLAFENSWCPDYVTEKFYRTLFYDTVPIVLGGADYSRFGPPDSYINAMDFASPKDLAKFILILNQSDTLYAKYFLWKKYYEILLPDNYGLCDLCRMAHDESLRPKIYHDIIQWWFESSECHNSSSISFSPDKNSSLFWKHQLRKNS